MFYNCHKNATLNNNIIYCELYILFLLGMFCYCEYFKLCVIFPIRSCSSSDFSLDMRP